jgi:hypothetical protein
MADAVIEGRGIATAHEIDEAADAAAEEAEHAGAEADVHEAAAVTAPPSTEPVAVSEPPATT